MSLTEYARKRDFKQTAEPKPKIARSRPKSRFVVQKHQASRLHYDFRLEMDGTLKSWAVPKGVPYAKGEKRLAMQVEDHPVSYIDFEGTIPQGQYGGGTVMVWDQGTFDILGKNELTKGKLHLVLHGQKLEGEWYLVQMRGGKEWLLIRGGSDFKPVSKARDDASALSGKSMSQLAKSGNFRDASQDKPAPSPRRPKFIEPMKARPVASLPKAGGWSFELKLDGYRGLAFKTGATVHLLSGNENNFATKFPEVVAAVAGLAAADCVLDGEIVALDEKGRPSFQLLQSLELNRNRPPVFFYVFDLLRLEGRDLRDQPLEERRARLEVLLRDGPPDLRHSATLAGAPEELLKRIRKLGLEGLIGKRKGSVYQPGERSGAWIKVKVIQEQEMVIGGYTDLKGTRRHFGALLLGYYEKGELRFAGKVGTGFNAVLLQGLHRKFMDIARPECPFVNLPEAKSGRYGQGITRPQMKRCHWLQPVLVCQVRFVEWTRDGKLRQPVFLGLREDKDATDVVRERTG